MKITKIEYLKTIIPKSSCGTGYSEPDFFFVTFEDGSKKELRVDIWYCPNDRKVFKEEIERIGGCDNEPQAYQAYRKALAHKTEVMVDNS